MKRAIEVSSPDRSIEQLYNHFVLNLPPVETTDECFFMRFWLAGHDDDDENGSGVMVHYLGVQRLANYEFIINDQEVSSCDMPLSLQTIQNFVQNCIGEPDYCEVVIGGEVVLSWSTDDLTMPEKKYSMWDD